MDEIEIMKECNGPEKLARKGLDVRAWKGHKGGALEEVEDAEAE